jgi:hypothetical protein
MNEFIIKNGFFSQGNSIVTGSFIVSPSNITELEVQSTGITVGNISSDIHKFTGSVDITGSLQIPRASSDPTPKLGGVYYNTSDGNIYRSDGIGWSASAGTSGTSGIGFDTINNASLGRILYSDGSTNAATASSDIVYRTTNPKGLSVTGSIFVTSSVGSPGNVTVQGNFVAFNVTSSTYIPTVNSASADCVGGVWNPASVSSDCAQWMRVGDVVTVSGQLNINPVGVGEAAVYVTLPIASSLTNACQIAGTAVSSCVSNNRTYGRVFADTTNDRAIIEFYNPFGTGVQFKLTYHFTYIIL